MKKFVLALFLMLPMLSFGSDVQLAIFYKKPLPKIQRDALLKRAGCTEILRIDTQSQWSDEVIVPESQLKVAKTVLRKSHKVSYVEIVTEQ